MQPVLLLNASYVPLAVIPWTKAVILLWQQKAEALAAQGRTLRSPSVTMECPSVLRLNNYVSVRPRGVKLSRKNLFYRDGYTCQYCGRRLPAKKLNLDHVIPRNQGGKSCWTNLVTACVRDNLKKGGRTPREAGMRLLSRPEQPRWSPGERIIASVGNVPDTWRTFLGKIADRARDR